MSEALQSSRIETRPGGAASSSPMSHQQRLEVRSNSVAIFKLLLQSARHMKYFVTTLSNTAESWRGVGLEICAEALDQKRSSVPLPPYWPYLVSEEELVIHESSPTLFAPSLPANCLTELIRRLDSEPAVSAQVSCVALFYHVTLTGVVDRGTDHGI